MPSDAREPLAAASEKNAPSRLCAVKGCESLAVEDVTFTADLGVVIIAPFCDDHERAVLATPNGPWRLLLDYDRVVVHRDR